MEKAEVEEEYVANIVQLRTNFALKYKDESWRPDKSVKNSLEKIGYTFGPTIGDGVYSKVKKAYCKKLNRDVAIKIIQKKRLPPEIHDKFIPREIALMQKLRHASLVVLHEVYDTPNTLYMVMEYAQNGDLLEYVNHQGSLLEVDTRRVMHQLLDVVSYLHDNLVYHRDIKLENILLDQFYNIRLSDLGFARYSPTNQLLDTFCGSYSYAAPEVLNGVEHEGSPVDVWSMGVCMFAMLNGKLPFRGEDADVLRLAQLEKVKFNKHVCKAGRDLLREFLNVLPNRRITIAAVRRSLWMRMPMQNDGRSLSNLSVSAVSSCCSHVDGLNPSAEHGFSCAQHSNEVKPSTVSNVLRAVAVNHSTGNSSVDLKQAIPLKKMTSDISMTTGVSGPAGRRLSVKLGITPGPEPGAGYRQPRGDGRVKNSPAALSTRAADPGTIDRDLTITPATAIPRGGKSMFTKAARSLSRFRMVARAVTAVRRFHRGPLTTILSMPQEQAMERVIGERRHTQQHEMKELHYSAPCRVAHRAKQERKQQELARQQSLTERQDHEQNRKKRRDLWDATIALLVPDRE